MRYRIEANIFGRGTAFDGYDLETVYTDDRATAEIMFRFFLDADVRPVRLIDEEDEHYTMKAENGMRTGC